MTDSPPKKFITGHSFDSVATDVRVDHGWKRLARERWEDNSGAIVIYLSSPEQLHGTHGITVYLAPGYYDRSNWLALKEMMALRKCQCVEL